MIENLIIVKVGWGRGCTQNLNNYFYITEIVPLHPIRSIDISIQNATESILTLPSEFRIGTYYLSH